MTAEELEVLDIETINEVYDTFYSEIGYMLSGYFRTLYNTLDFVDRSIFSLPEKQSYSNLVRAQLSTHELSLLFYVCLVTSDNKYENLLVLVTKYKLLEYLDSRSLVEPAHRELMEQLTADL